MVLMTYVVGNETNLVVFIIFYYGLEIFFRCEIMLVEMEWENCELIEHVVSNCFLIVFSHESNLEGIDFPLTINLWTCRLSHKMLLCSAHCGNWKARNCWNQWMQIGKRRKTFYECQLDIRLSKDQLGFSLLKLFVHILIIERVTKKTKKIQNIAYQYDD